VLNEQSSEHSQPTSAATSELSPSRPIGIFDSMYSRTSGAVSLCLGATINACALELTCTPAVASSLPPDVASAWTAP